MDQRTLGASTVLGQRCGLRGGEGSGTRASTFRRGREPPAGSEKLEQPVSGARRGGLILQLSAQFGRRAPAHRALEFPAGRVWAKGSPWVDSREVRAPEKLCLHRGGGGKGEAERM